MWVVRCMILWVFLFLSKFGRRCTSGGGFRGLRQYETLVAGPQIRLITVRLLWGCHKVAVSKSTTVDSRIKLNLKCLKIFHLGLGAPPRGTLCELSFLLEQSDGRFLPTVDSVPLPKLFSSSPLLIFAHFAGIAAALLVWKIRTEPAETTGYGTRHQDP